MKGYFAPDAIAGLVAIVFVVVLGLLFVNFFASGLLMHAIMQISDAERPLSCELFLYSVVGDEYCRYALPESSEFGKVYKYYGGYNEEGNVWRLSQRIEKAVKEVNDSEYVNISCFEVYVGHDPTKMKACHEGISCTVPIYSPAGEECYAAVSYKATFGK